MIRNRLAVLLALAFTAVFVRDAQALASRTFVASYGSDTNTCSISAPCRTFAQALLQIAVRGQIIVLDSAGYGPVVVTQSVSLLAPLGVRASITAVPASPAIAVNAPGATVLISGLTTRGKTFSAEGLDVAAVLSLHLDRFEATGFQHGVLIEAPSSEVFIDSAFLHGNAQAGIWSTVSSALELTNSRVEGNGQGLHFISASFNSARGCHPCLRYDR